MKDWFCTWFNSSYYPVLYRNRDDKEAAMFVDELLKFLNPPRASKIIDIACGRGRHSVYLNKKGFDVTGVDLSESSIDYAKKFENKKLSFFLHDMRKTTRVNYFNYAFNLFTSFGYFEMEKDNIDALQAMARSLKPNGVLVLDYLNSEKAITALNAEETKEIENIQFNISKTIKGNFIVKKIAVNDKGKISSFEEKVRMIRLDTFKEYFQASGLTITHLFGDHQLKNFNASTSDRLIIVAEKKPI